MDTNIFFETDRNLLLLFNGSNSPFVDAWALTLTSAWTWLPLYLSLFYLVVKNNGKWSQIGVVVGACAFCLLLSAGVSELVVKPLIERLRPSHDPSLQGLLDLAMDYRGSGYSFFSSHASNTFSLAIFFSLLVRSRAFTMAMIFWSLLNCWTRLYLGVHYPSDILVGLIWGAFVGQLTYIVYMYFYMKVTAKLHYISTQYTRSGYSLSDINVVISVLVLTIIYAILRAVIMAGS